MRMQRLMQMICWATNLLAGDETVENVETEIDAEDIDVETETEEAADAEETVTE